MTAGRLVVKSAAAHDHWETERAMAAAVVACVLGIVVLAVLAVLL